MSEARAVFDAVVVSAAPAYSSPPATPGAQPDAVGTAEPVSPLRIEINVPAYRLEAFVEVRELASEEAAIELFDGKHGGIAYRYPGAIRELDRYGWAAMTKAGESSSTPDHASAREAACRAATPMDSRAFGAKAPAATFVLQMRRRREDGPVRVGFTVSKRIGNAPPS
mgnify:CR=1 FL=1